MTDGWSTGAAPVEKPLSLETQHQLGKHGNETALIQAWETAANALMIARVAEMQLRLAVFEIKFPHAKEGVNRIELNSQGWNLKAQYPYRYDLSNKEAKTERAIDAMAEISQQAGFIADRLIKWEPELSIKEYRLLNPDNSAAQTDEQKKILALLQPILKITPGSPQLEIEPPKAK